MKPEIQINMLGEFSVSYAGKRIDQQTNRSKNIWTFLAYLITFRERDVAQNELIELLYPHEEVKDPANTLKTLLHRLRSMLSSLGIENVKNLICYSQNLYNWNNELPCTIDAEVFKEACNSAMQPELSEKERLERLLRAIDLYPGHFLPKNALDAWVVPINAQYHAQYTRLLNDVLDLLWIANDQVSYEKIVTICQKAIIIDPYTEFLHCSLIKAYLALNKHQQALFHYDYVTDLFYTTFSISPSDELKALYKEVLKTNKYTELDLDIIKDGLLDKDPVTGAFYCEYEFFKTICRLESRYSQRTGRTAYIALVSLIGKHGSVLGQNVLRRYMDHLAKTLFASMRRGDIFTRYSLSQYLILLTHTSSDNTEKVLRRIVSSFHRLHPKASVFLRYTIEPLLDSEDMKRFL